MKLQKFLIVMCITFIGYFLYQTFTTPTKPKILLQHELEKAVEIENIPDLNINNNRNGNILNFKCDKVKIVAWYRGVPYKLKGEMAYEKDKLFRMVIKSILAKEADIGSNEEIFWFWFKRMKPDALYFAKHEDLEKARMKTPFHPIWIMKSLGLDKECLSQDSRIFQTDCSWIIKKLTKDSNGRLVYKAVLFDKEMMRIKGYILQDAVTKRTIAASVIMSYTTRWSNGRPVFLPQKMAYSWYEEDITMLLEFENPEINGNIPLENWVMPEGNLIDMGNETTDSATAG